MALSLLNISPSVDAIRRDDAAARLRILQKKEANMARMLQNGRADAKDKSGGKDKGPTSTRGSSKKFSDPKHSSNFDTNDNGITLDDVEYVYGDPIAVSFELINEHVPDDVLATLDVDKMDEWRIGVYMRMADPQGGSEQPIVSVVPAIVGARRSRRAQEEDDEELPPETREPPTLDHVGTAVIDATDYKTLNPNRFGTGFDVYLIDGKGGEIMGPATFYMTKTEEMIERDEAKKNKIPDHPLASFDHSAKKKKGVVGTAAKPQRDWGKGTGMDGEMILKTKPSLEKYVLETDMEEYPEGSIVTVTYDLMLDATERRRFLQNGQANGVGNGNGNGNGNVQEDTTTAATSAADQTATTSTEEPNVDMGAGEELSLGYDPQPEIDEGDVTLYSMGIYMRMANPQMGALRPLYSVPFCPVGEGEECTKTAEELQAGEFTFSTDLFDLKKTGTGLDVWILNGAGHGIAGPVTFYIIESEI